MLKKVYRSVRPNTRRWYGWYDPRSWIGLSMLMHQYRIPPRKLLEGMQVLTYIREKQRYLCTLPRSGTNYITCVLKSASDIELGGTGDYHYLGDRWIHNIWLNYPAAPNKFIELLNRWHSYPIHPNIFLVSHHPLTRGMIDVNDMKIVFTVRHILDQLESWLRHQGYDHTSQDEFIRKGYVEKTIRYFNYWGDFIHQPNLVAGDDYVCIRYEDLSSNPHENLLRITNLWSLEIQENSIKRALELCSRENMVSKIPNINLDKNKRITVRSGHGNLFSDKNMAYIHTAIRDNLRHSFGYLY